MSALALLGVTRVGPLLWLVALTAAASGAGGFWTGKEWTEGRTAQREVVDLRADASALREAAEGLRKTSVESAQDARTAARRMDLIATQHQESLDAIDSLFVVQRDALDTQLASAAATDLLRCRIGAFGVQVWNDAAAGAAPAARAAAADSEWSENALPGDPSHIARRFWRGDVTDASGDSAAVLSLPEPASEPREGSD